MPVDPDEGLVTDLMLGMIVIFGVDIIALVGFMWLSNTVSAVAFGGVTAVVLGGFGSWVGWRWWEIRKLQSTDEPNRTALEELKYRYAAGELSEAAFERKLDRLVELEDHTQRAERETEDRTQRAEVELEGHTQRAERETEDRTQRAEIETEDRAPERAE